MRQANVTWLLLFISAVMAVVGIAAYRSGVSDYVVFYSYGAMWICLYVTTSFASSPRAVRSADDDSAPDADEMRGRARADSFDPAR